MKKVLAFAAAAMVFAAAGCSGKPAESEAPSESSSDSQAAAKFTPGTYEGTAKGYGGDLKVAVTLNEEGIEKVEVLEHSETQDVGTSAIEQLPARMVEQQVYNVDTVAGATVTSNAIIEAAKAALAEAGVDLSLVTGENAAPVEGAPAAVSGGFQDGTYRAELTDEEAQAGHGWRDTLEVTYQDGKVVKAVFDSVNANGELKSQSTAESYQMEPHPTEWIPQLSENILSAGNSADIELIAGATSSSNNAVKLMALIEKMAGPAPEQDAQYADGTYRAALTDEEAQAGHGWRDTLEVTYQDGKVVKAVFDSVNANGELKSQSTAESYQMEPHPTEWIPQLSENILSAGNSADIELIAGATSSSNSAVKLMALIEKMAAN